MASQQLSGRAASRARRQMQVAGKHSSTKASVAASSASISTPASSVRPVASQVIQSDARQASRTRRQAMSSCGKAAAKGCERQRSEAHLRAQSSQNARQADCGCGRDCCQEAKAEQPTTLIAQVAGSKVLKKVRPAATASSNGRLVSKARRSAMSGRGKVGQEAHSKGVSSASLARQANPDISSRDLARAVRESRSRSGAPGAGSSQPTRRPRPKNAAEAKRVSGTQVGHSEKITGVEAGLCHSGITGTEYFAADIFESFCQSNAPKAPRKVETTQTLSGGRVTTGGMVGSSSKLTGVERGSCREVTGSEYLGREHFAQCETTPKATPAKVSQSQTQRGTVISGPKSSRAEKVSGNERGSCKAVTGTPYAGLEQFESFCSGEEQRDNRQRTAKNPAAAGKEISGIQPGLMGKRMTGSEAGTCQRLSGTPYVASTELKAVCAAKPAQFDEGDFPQIFDDSGLVVGQFSLVPMASPAASKAESAVRSSVTGSGYEGTGPVTGAFSMGKGKVTGTEQSRFGDRAGNVISIEPKSDNADVLARVTGEGLDKGLRITGDDWDRGDRVTGTEGGFAARRNPTRRGPMSAMQQPEAKREPMRDRPSANVTGGSGGTQGSNVTVSGGARG